MRDDRRGFLRRSGYFIAGAGLAGPLSALSAVQRAQAVERRDAAMMADPAAGGYGPLVADPVLSLPPDFTYLPLSPAGTVMSNGAPVPPGHDGMACFAMPDGTLRLIRNHELHDVGAFGAGGYNPNRMGGTTTVVFDPSGRGAELATHPTVTGLVRPCGGGPTPWGSWLACEETTATLDGIRHGYVFEVPATADAPVAPVPLRAMGRFNHEAVAVDPDTGCVYETEDRDASGIFRLKPNVPGELRHGGALQMLALTDAPGDTRTGQSVGVPLRATWVPIEDPDPDDRVFQADDGQTLYREGLRQGGATFARGEGACTGYAGPGSTRIYWASTSGGDIGFGQIWEYTPDARGDDGTLRLLYESTTPEVLAHPDNLTVHPRTGTVVLCEDGEVGTRQRLSGVTADGTLFQLAEQTASEFAGACFSPDGRWLFVNMQARATTYAITGPWHRGALSNAPGHYRRTR